jgi:hypothetical protein
MTSAFVTLADLANQAENRRRSQQKIREEDKVAKKIIAKYKLRVRGDRTPIAHGGWNSSYCLQSEGDESRSFKITLRSSLSQKALEEDIRLQIQTALNGTKCEGL